METAAVRCYGTGGWGLTGNCSSAMLRHRWVGSDSKLQQCDVTAPVVLVSDWKLQQCDVTALVRGGLIGNCSSAMLRHWWVWV